MSTPNFPQPQLKNIYAFGFDCEDQFQFDDEMSNLMYEVEQIDGFNNLHEWDNDRRRVGAFYFQVYDKDLQDWYTLPIYVLAISGYYNGAMIDVDFSEMDKYEIGKTLQKKIDQKINKLERVLKKNTLPMRRTALFSNGEAMYERVE